MKTKTFALKEISVVLLLKSCLTVFKNNMLSFVRNENRIIISSAKKTLWYQKYGNLNILQMYAKFGHSKILRVNESRSLPCVATVCPFPKFLNIEVDDLGFLKFSKQFATWAIPWNNSVVYDKSWIIFEVVFHFNACITTFL